jgi:hypothetical protein
MIFIRSSPFKDFQPSSPNLLCGKGVRQLNKSEVKKALDEALQKFSDEIRSGIETSSFEWRQKEEIEFLMKQVYYTLSDFQKVIEKIAD